jgi:hypothetical protein
MVSSVPLGVAAVAGNGEVTVRWSPPANDGGSSIARYTATATPGSQNCTTTSGEPLTCSISHLANGGTYLIDVVAVNIAGTSKPSVAVKSSPQSVPSPPLGISGYTNLTSVTIFWTASLSDGGRSIVHYTVTAAPGGAHCVVPAKQMSCTISKLKRSSTYVFTVTAANSVGKSNPSSPFAIDVGHQGTSVKLAVFGGSAIVGQAIGVGIEVTSPHRTPPGFVRVKLGTKNVGYSSIVNGKGITSLGILPAGTYVLTAQYLGSGVFDASTSLPLTLVVHPDPTSLSMAASATGGKGQHLVIVAVTLNVLPPAHELASGTIEIFEGSKLLGSVSARKTSRILVTVAKAGANLLRAQFEGSFSLAPSTRSLVVAAK